MPSQLWIIDRREEIGSVLPLCHGAQLRMEKAHYGGSASLLSSPGQGTDPNSDSTQVSGSQ